MRKQSGVVPYRIKGDKIEVMLIRTIAGKNWGFPKGGKESGITKKENAAKEAYEEAGIEGKVEPSKLGSFEYVKGKTGKKQKVDMFLMKVTKELSEYPESGMRKRKWFESGKAKDKVQKDFIPFIDATEKRLGR